MCAGRDQASQPDSCQELGGIDELAHHDLELARGATHSLLALRQVLAVGCRALVIAEQVTVPNAEQAFDEMDELKDARAASQLKVVVRKLIETAKLLT